MAAALLVVFFLPLAGVLGLGRARRMRPAIGEGESLAGPLWRLLLPPLLVLLCLLVALAEIGSHGGGRIAALLRLGAGGTAPGAEPTIYTGVAAMDFVLWLMLKGGQLMLILFFLSVPYVLGSLVAAGLLVADRTGRTDLLRRPPRAAAEPGEDP
jgi:hypothetical protein